MGVDRQRLRGGFTPRWLERQALFFPGQGAGDNGQADRDGACLQQRLEQAATADSGEVEQVEDLGRRCLIAFALFDDAHPRQPSAKVFVHRLKVARKVGDDCVRQPPGTDARGHEQQRLGRVHAIADVSAQFRAEARLGVSVRQTVVDEFDQGADCPCQVVLKLFGDGADYLFDAPGWFGYGRQVCFGEVGQ